MSLTQSTLALGFFYAKHDKSLRNEYISFLPKALQKNLVEAKELTYSPKTLDFETLFYFIHPSHITDYLCTLSNYEAKTFLSALKEHNANEYIQPLNIEPFTPFSLNSGYKNFLLKHLYAKTLASKNCLSQELFKHEPFIHLLYFDFHTFNRFLQILAMYDIHIELHTVISKEQLKKLTKALNPDQCQFLSNLKRQVNAEAYHPMGLVSFDGNRTKLDLILRQRALNRLAKALCSSQKEFLDQIYLRLSNVEKALFYKLLNAYQGKEFNKEQERLNQVVSFIKG